MALIFGRTTAGVSTGTFEDYIIGSVHSCPINCIAEKLSGCLRILDAAKNVKGAIYKLSDLSLIGSTPEVNIPISAEAWFDFPFANPKPNLVSGVNYILVLWCQPGTGVGNLWRASGFPADHTKYESRVYNGFPATLTPADLNMEYCINCTYSLPTNPYPTEWLKKGLISGFHVFLNQYLKSKVLGYDPLKLPDGTLF